MAYNCYIAIMSNKSLSEYDAKNIEYDCDHKKFVSLLLDINH